MRADSKGERTRNALVAAAIRVVASEGLAALSYRKVANAAGVSLALVNYHFPAKAELVANLSATVLRQYAKSIELAIERISSATPATFDDMARRLLRHAITRDLDHTMAWAEIVLEAARRPESVVLAREWDSELQRLWTGLAVATGHDASPVAVRSETDLLMGLLFLCLALRIDENSLAGTLEGVIPENMIASSAPSLNTPKREKTSPKAFETKARIVAAVIDILKDHGTAAISFRAIAERADLSLAAPSYYFSSIADLLSHSQITLTERSKDRYRQVMNIADRGSLSPTQLIDLTTTIFVREATESGADNLAFFANWLEAARRTELRPVIQSFVESQIAAWQRVLPRHKNAPSSKRSGLLAMSLFLGKLLRIISTGSTTTDLARSREEFLYALQAITNGEPESCFSRSAAEVSVVQ